ncbi:MAG: hypothetical protein ACXWUD_07020 [Methylosarcina sp.]
MTEMPSLKVPGIIGLNHQVPNMLRDLFMNGVMHHLMRLRN